VDVERSHFVLHSCAEVDGCVEITPGLYLDGTRESMAALVRGGVADASQFQFVVG